MKRGQSTTRYLIVKFQKHKHKKENSKSFQKHIAYKGIRMRLTSPQSHQIVEEHGAIPSKFQRKFVDKSAHNIQKRLQNNNKWTPMNPPLH